MDNLTKGALGATIVLILGVVGFGYVSTAKKTSQMAAENQALKEQMAEDRRQRDDDKSAEMERRMEEQRKSTQEQLAAMRAEMAASSKTVTEAVAAERRIMEAEREQLSETIAETVKGDGTIPGEEMTAMQKKIRDAASIGEIVQVNAELGFVVVGAGSANGVQPEQHYNVRRDMFLVGEVEIVSVEDERHSVANIVAGSTQPGLTLRAGDQLISHPIF